MAVNLKELNDGKVLEIAASGKLTDEDYQYWVPEFERLAEAHGKIRLIFEMCGFHGWEAKAMWDDLKFGVKHFNHIERLAMVGERKWQHWMSAFCRPFTAAKVRYFDAAESDQTRAWIQEDIAKEHAAP